MIIKVICLPLNINQLALHNIIDVKDEIGFHWWQIKVNSVNIHFQELGDQWWRWCLSSTTCYKNVTKNYCQCWWSFFNRSYESSRTRMTIRYDVYLDRSQPSAIFSKNNATYDSQEIRSKNGGCRHVLYQFVGTSMVKMLISLLQKRWKWSSACRCYLCSDGRWYSSRNKLGTIRSSENGVGTIFSLIKQAYIHFRNTSSKQLCSLENLSRSAGWFWKWPRISWSCEQEKDRNSLRPKDMEW